MLEITPIELKDYLETTSPKPLLLDVREPEEWAICHIEGSMHIPMDQIPDVAERLDPEQEIVVICHYGGRSARVASYLEQTGFSKVINLVGGVDAWAREVDRDMAIY